MVKVLADHFSRHKKLLSQNRERQLKTPLFAMQKFNLDGFLALGGRIATVIFQKCNIEKK